MLDGSILRVSDAASDFRGSEQRVGEFIALEGEVEYEHEEDGEDVAVPSSQVNRAV